MTETQTLSAGVPTSQKYGSALGFTTKMLPIATRMMMCVVGRSGEGKSYLMQSCGGAHIINADLGSTSNPNMVASMWPGMRRDGTPVIPDPNAPLLKSGSPDPEKGTPFFVSWQELLDHKDLLIEMAKDGWEGRPKMCVLDTADAAYAMLQMWMVDQHNLTADSDKQKSDFTDLHGMTAWPKSYRHLLNYGRDLRTAGYGFCYLFHLDDKQIHLSEKEKVWITDAPRVPENCFQTIKGHCEMVLQMALEERTIYKEWTPKVNGKDKMIGGKKVVNKTETGKKVVAVLTADPTRLRKVCKRRNLHFPAAIELPQDDPWGTYERVYDESVAASDTKKEALSQ